MIEDFKRRRNEILSLDFETTGLNPKTDKIWSIGIAGGNQDKEYFINPTKHKAGQGAIEEIASLSSFGKSQLDAGRLNPLKDAINTGAAQSQRNAIRHLDKALDGSSALLIQNINFENNFLAEATSSGQLGQKLEDKFRYRSEIFDGRLLYTPPAVTSLRTEANFSYSDYLKSGDRNQLNQTLQSYDKLMQAYHRELASKSSGIFTIELMDITKATYAKAISKNLLDPNSINIGTNVNFLSQALLGEKEQHTSLDDAKKQLRIFEKLLGIQSELDSNNISPETRKIIGRIKATQSTEASRQYLAAIRNTLQEIETSGSTRLLGDAKQLTRNTVGILDKEGNRHTISTVQYLSSKTTSDPTRAIAEVNARYRRTFTRGLDRKALSDRLIGMGSNAERIEALEKDIASYDELISKRLGTDQTLTDKVEDIAGKAKTKWQNIPKSHKILGGVGLAALGLYAASGGKDEEKNYEEIAKQKREEASIQRRIKMYSHARPIVYHGSGFADWNERTKHYEY